MYNEASADDSLWNPVSHCFSLTSHTLGQAEAQRSRVAAFNW